MRRMYVMARVEQVDHVLIVIDERLPLRIDCHHAHPCMR
jgi:hypothetical protein